MIARLHHISIVPALLSLLLPIFAAKADPTWSPNRILVIANREMPAEEGTDNTPASIYVAKQYAAARHIPKQNILTLSLPTTEDISNEDFQKKIEEPLKTLLRSNSNRLRRKILAIVPMYGVPIRIPYDGKESRSVDERISKLFREIPFGPNPYYSPTPARLEPFERWADKLDKEGTWRPYIVTRLDGPSAALASQLISRTQLGERSITFHDSQNYFDLRNLTFDDSYSKGDISVREAAFTSIARGFPTAIHEQEKDELCQRHFAPAALTKWNEKEETLFVQSIGQRSFVTIPIAPADELTLELMLNFERPAAGGSGISIILRSETASISLDYPLARRKTFALSISEGEKRLAEKALEAELEGIHQAVRNLTVTLNDDSILLKRDGLEIITASRPEDFKTVRSIDIEFRCVSATFEEVEVQSPKYKEALKIDFKTDAFKHFKWKLAPKEVLRARFFWGWYNLQAHDSYDFLPGSVGAHLTSYTAERLRTPYNEQDEFYRIGSERWRAAYVPRMLEEGITATWGPVSEPFLERFPLGDVVLSRMWKGYTFGESYLAAQEYLGWVMLAIGDPLYAIDAFRPYKNDYTIPDAPTALQIAEQRDQSIKLSWTPPAVAGGVTGYKVYGLFGKKLIPLTGSTTSDALIDRSDLKGITEMWAISVNAAGNESVPSNRIAPPL